HLELESRCNVRNYFCWLINEKAWFPQLRLRGKYICNRGLERVQSCNLYCSSSLKSSRCLRCN
uniref:Zf-3CxxC domain-containing protein n=1 Tax=Mesocestoides corti TaxID=53468 RepID=A0A5K3EQ75_MESCO